MKRIVGYPSKRTAQLIANSKDGLKHKCFVRRNNIKLFGKKVKEWAVFCK